LGQLLHVLIKKDAPLTPDQSPSVAVTIVATAVDDDDDDDDASVSAMSITAVLK